MLLHLPYPLALFQVAKALSPTCLLTCLDLPQQVLLVCVRNGLLSNDLVWHAGMHTALVGSWSMLIVDIVSQLWHSLPR